MGAAFRRATRAFVLLAVLIVTLLASMVAISLLFRMKAEDAADTASEGSQQAWSAAMTGIYHAMRIAATAPSGSLAWQDSPAVFQQQLVTDDGSEQWYYSVFTPARLGSPDIRYGLSDEAGKLNINSPASEGVEKLTELSPALAQGLLDFIDPDRETRPEGAEQNEYAALGRTYAVRNDKLATLGEVLLVRGFTPSVLYGEEPDLLARLGLTQPDQPQPTFSRAETGAPGLVSLLTVSSYDPNWDAHGQPRLDLNSSNDFSGLNLPDSVLVFLNALHANHKTISAPAELLELKMTLTNEQGQAVEMSSGVGKAELPILLDRTTATNAQRFPGLININTAPAPVLASIPGIDSALADSIVAARRGLDPETRKTTAWLYTQGLVDAESFQKIAPRLTARACQFSFQVIGYSLPSGRYRVLEVMIDLAARPPAITYLRDLTRLGLPFQIETESTANKNG